MIQFVAWELPKCCAAVVLKCLQTRVPVCPVCRAHGGGGGVEVGCVCVERVCGVDEAWAEVEGLMGALRQVVCKGWCIRNMCGGRSDGRGVAGPRDVRVLFWDDRGNCPCTQTRRDPSVGVQETRTPGHTPTT